MIVWCASYPKSGNTWVKAIITSLLYSEDGIFNFDMLKKIGQFPIRHQFKDFIDALMSTATTTALIFLILLGAAVFNAFLGFSQLPLATANFFKESGFPPMAVLLMMV